MRACAKCQETKPLRAFYKNGGKKRGRMAWCKACQDKRTVAWNKDPKNKSTMQRMWWKSKLKSKFGLTEEAYMKLLEWSEGGCAICGERPHLEHRKVKRLAVDHSHATGKVRGLLCINCNQGLGRFKDNKQLLRVAIAYLEYFEPDKTE